MCGVTRECAVTRERMTSPVSSWEKHGPASVCAICYSHDRWSWALNSTPTFVFQVYVSYFSFWMLHMFYLNVTYVAMTIHVCCRWFFLDVVCFYLNIAYITVAIHVCCKCMFHLAIHVGTTEAGGDVERSSRRRRAAQQHADKRSSMRERLDARVCPDVRTLAWPLFDWNIGLNVSENM